MATTEIFAPDGDITILMHHKKQSCSAGIDLLEGQSPSSEKHDEIPDAIADDEAVKTDSASTTPSARLRVSSAHLSHTSPAFRAMFTANMRESRALQKDGHLNLELLDDNPTAFRTVMAVIHCTSEKVPDELSLDELIEVCLIVDKYQMHSAMGFMLKRWKHGISKDLYFVLQRQELTSSIPWLFILQVCRDSDNFRDLSYMVIRHATSAFGSVMMSHKVPLSSKLIEIILATRVKLLQELASVITRKLSQYESFEVKLNKDKNYSTSGCGNHKGAKQAEICRNLTLGSLMSVCHDKGLRNASFESTFSGSVWRLYVYLLDCEYMSTGMMIERFRCRKNCQSQSPHPHHICNGCKNTDTMQNCTGAAPGIKMDLLKVMSLFKGLDVLSLEPVSK